LKWPLTLPILGSDEDGIKFGLFFIGNDALDLHDYTLSVLYGPKSGRFGVELDYRYNRFFTPIGFFGYDRSEEYAEYFEASDEDDESYWERQQGGGVGIGIPLYRTRRTALFFATEYEYQERSRLTEAPPEDQQSLPPDTGVFTDIAARLVWKSFDFHRFSISPEAGFLASAEYRRYDEALGGDYTINAFIGDLNGYINMPFRQHVLALRAAGGTSDGDTLTQGVFQLGGLFFEVQADLLNRPQYYLRGYERRQFRGDRFVLGTAEYRLPIWYVERSTLNGLLYWNSIAATAFVDAGHAWEDAIEDPDLKYGAGGELSLNVGYRYGQVPLSFDIGVAYGFDEDVGVTQVYFQLRTFLL
jgi:outer membrane protein assembly factor BamA